MNIFNPFTWFKSKPKPVEIDQSKFVDLRIVAATGHATRHPSNPFGRPISKVLPPKVIPNRRKNDAPEVWGQSTPLTWPALDLDVSTPAETTPAVFNSGGGGDFGGGGASGSWDSGSSSDSSSSSSSSSD